MRVRSKIPTRLPKTKKQILPWLFFVALALLLSSNLLPKEPTEVLGTNQPGFYSITSFDDGDTIQVDMNGTKEKVRMIGVDTPETHDPRKNVQCYGEVASQYTKSTIGNSKVKLLADPTNQNRDRYNRLLRYVYLEDGRLLNAELIKNGYGFAYTGFPFEKIEEFREYQRQAQENNLGLWSSCSPTKNEFGGFTSNDAN